MKYVVLTYESPDDFAARTDGVRQATYWATWKSYGEAMAGAGIVSSMHGLQPASTASTVRLRNGRREVNHASYADTPDQLGGYFVIDVADQNQAIEWAARCPAAVHGAVEVRPVLG